ncbi:MAG: carboxypeptidase regulatory-like domain-containing protein [Deltaproteobacteria bacterium]|nr:carboxypeptidase regulatory-like domain-containing protein [Deltaproteobacteria bacterium]
MKFRNAVLLILAALVLTVGCKKKETVETTPSPAETDVTTPPAAGQPADATISGKVVFKGTAPQPKKLDMAADPNCKALYSNGKFDEDVVVNANGTLKNVFVSIKEGVPAGDYPLPANPVILDQKGCWYQPHVFGIRANQDLVILNSDATLHNVHSLANINEQFNLGMPLQGMKITKKFTKPEVMAKFKCDVHGWMHAYVGILDHPFFAVTNESGSFQLPALPAGQYVIEAWHEKFGTQTQTVTLGSKETKSIEFVFTSGS